MMKKIGKSLLILLLAGCASAVEERVSNDYMLQGAAAQSRGDWDTARRAYAQAALNADRGGLPAARRAVLHYEYGRSLGATCLFDQSQHELNVAYDLDKQAGQLQYFSLIELARLSLDQRKFTQSVDYFERALPALDEVRAASVAPIGYADVLDEYAQALAGAENAVESKIQVNRAAALRAGKQIKRSITDRTPYGKYCTPT